MSPEREGPALAGAKSEAGNLKLQPRDNTGSTRKQKAGSGPCKGGGIA